MITSQGRVKSMIVKGGKVDKSTCRYGNFSHIASDDSTEKTKKKVHGESTLHLSINLNFPAFNLFVSTL